MKLLPHRFRAFAAAGCTGLALSFALAAAPAGAQEQAPPQRGPELRLPGMPPIQLPPGTRVFGPNGDSGGSTTPLPPSRRNRDSNRDSNRVEREDAPGSRATTGGAGSGKTSAKAKQETKPRGRDAILTDLFNRLGKAKSAAEARGIVRNIEQAWLQSGSDTADLLMNRAQQAMKKKNFKLALQLFDKMVVLEPGWSEVWHQRATARYYEDDPDGAVADIARALAREPRHFSALVGLGFILRRANQEKLALQVFRKALEINPQLTDIKSTIEKLEISVEGQGI
ncbi:MAG: tetratricopeptide repeat protein [Beijerinckiaceae bacterium]